MADQTTRFLIIGAGITGLSFANFIDDPDYLIVEVEDQIGGWCKTVHQDGFVWDYSGHFFHFKHPDIEAYLRARMMPDEPIVTVAKNSLIHLQGSQIDFPFQKNIHQLPRELFLDALHDLVFRDEAAALAPARSFKGMLFEKFGQTISELFLIPYNEKLYACDLEDLDRDAMGRFFPHADLKEIVRNFRTPDNRSYNSTFTYPLGGAIRYVQALARDLPSKNIRCADAVVSLDLPSKIAHLQSGETISFEHLISSAPFDRLLTISGLAHDPADFSANKVLVYNLGFDSKGIDGVHWIYYPERKVSFYRVGFYDNIMGSNRMSLYVEIGLPPDADLRQAPDLERVLDDLRRVAVITDQKLLSHHRVVLDPAYVHITAASKQSFQDLSKTLKLAGVHSIGRYGGWTYCSIEDNIIEARDLARRFNHLESSRQ